MSRALNKFLNWSNNLFSEVLQNLFIAIIIILFGFILGRIAGKLLQKFLKELEVDSIIKKATGHKSSLEKLISSFVKYFIYFLSVIMALNQLGLTTTILYMIAGAALIIIIVSVLMGIKDIIPNLLAGFSIYRKDFLHIGETIRFKNIEGKIISISLVETRLKAKNGDLIAIPNTLLSKTEISVVKTKTKSKK